MFGNSAPDRTPQRPQVNPAAFHFGPNIPAGGILRSRHPLAFDQSAQGIANPQLHQGQVLKPQRLFRYGHFGPQHPGLDAFREALLSSVRAPAGPFIVANYDRAALDQTGTGHFSPLAAWHAPTDHVLVLDVARFKYPPHWVPVERLWAAMCVHDSSTQAPRGYLVMNRADRPQQPDGLDALLTRLKGCGVTACPPEMNKGSCHD